MLRSKGLLRKLECDDLDLILRQRNLRKIGDVEHFSGAVRTACDLLVHETTGQGDPR